MNEMIFYFFYNFAHQSIFVDKLIIFFAQTFPYIVAILAGLFLLFHHEIFKADNTIIILKQKYKEIFSVFLSGGLAWIFSKILKFLFHTLRPFEIFPQVQSLFPENGYAFPSSHATFFMALAVVLFFNHKKAGYFFMFFALLIGIARIMSGVHFPIDILGGFALGVIISLLVRFLYLKFAYSNRKM